MQVSASKFRKMPLAFRHKMVEEQGTYLTTRRHLNYHIELFQLHGFYVEVWRSFAINQIQWIECPSADRVAEAYVSPQILKSLL